MTDRDVIATLGLALLGAAQLLARPDKTVDLLRGKGWYDDQIPASWHHDQAQAERIAAVWAERRANRNG